MIGKLKNNIKLNNMKLENLQEHILPIADIDINNNCESNIGIVLEQRRNIFHKHTNIVYNDIDSRRNVCIIRIKYLQ
jgi:hypothetical protein